MADGKEPLDKAGEKTGGVRAGAGEGIRSIRSTSLFRAVNFELYAKPNKWVMGFGLAALTSCVVYIAYLNAQKENQRDRDMYEQYQADGTTIMRPRNSKWD
ncbi:small integral membrane protein 8-like [Lytechinus pictus]|uniref:small integral membrane protein 8-like n=1 Tax=Lytechinus pictus TaxID=7653 RepID=UPI00240CEC30|nr:small integral membrane protein 8-like [Lytechinus pictus]XP_054765958.1 small integral membrane protein 8-like [Lytechinus pictus]